MRLIGCYECDGVAEEPLVPNGGSAVCQRCGATLFRRQRETVAITLALVTAAGILLIVANAFPLLLFELQGQQTSATLISGVLSLWAQAEYPVSALVFLTTIFAPMSQVALLLYVLVPIYLGWRNPWAIAAFRWVEILRPWSMMEVFLIGVLVALVKLTERAEMTLGIAFWAFALLIPTLAGAIAFLDAEIIWRKLEEGQ